MNEKRQRHGTIQLSATDWIVLLSTALILGVIIWSCTIYPPR